MIPKQALPIYNRSTAKVLEEAEPSSDIHPKYSR
jgi:hypothetical protein